MKKLFTFSLLAILASQAHSSKEEPWDCIKSEVKNQILAKANELKGPEFIGSLDKENKRRNRPSSQKPNFLFEEIINIVLTHQGILAQANPARDKITLIEDEYNKRNFLPLAKQKRPLMIKYLNLLIDENLITQVVENEDEQAQKWLIDPGTPLDLAYGNYIRKRSRKYESHPNLLQEMQFLEKILDDPHAHNRNEEDLLDLKKRHNELWNKLFYPSQNDLSLPPTEEDIDSPPSSKKQRNTNEEDNEGSEEY